MHETESLKRRPSSPPRPPPPRPPPQNSPRQRFAFPLPLLTYVPPCDSITPRLVTTSSAYPRTTPLTSASDPPRIVPSPLTLPSSSSSERPGWSLRKRPQGKREGGVKKGPSEGPKRRTNEPTSDEASERRNERTPAFCARFALPNRASQQSRRRCRCRCRRRSTDQTRPSGGQRSIVTYPSHREHRSLRHSDALSSISRQD